MRNGAARSIVEPSDGFSVSTRDLVMLMSKAMRVKSLLFPVPIGLLIFAGRIVGRADSVSGAFEEIKVDPIIPSPID